MDAILLQILNGLDKGSAYALIALGLTLIFGTLGVVNFAHGALFMLGAFTAVTFRNILTMQKVVLSETETTAWGTPLETRTPYAEIWFGDFGQTLIEYSVPVSILLAVPIMLVIGLVIERGLIKHFYKRPHADQILVTFGLAIVLQEIIKAWFGANPIPQPAPDTMRGMVDLGAAIGMTPGNIVYPLWRYLIPPAIAEATTDSVVAGKVAEFKNGSGTIVKFGSRPAIVVRTAEGEFRAFSAVCTHLDCTVQYKADTSQLWCACHNGHYDLHGRNVSGPPPRPLEAYDAAEQGDEIVISKRA